MKDEYSCNNGPVFIVGMNGSGTTMLADCLGNHPDLYVFPYETRILPHFISRMKFYGNLSEESSRRKLANALGRSFAFWRANNNKQVILDDESLKQPGFSGVVDSLYRYFSASEGKTRWGDKSPMYLQHVSLLATHFPEARFVHIYRDGRDVAQSFHRRWKKDPRRTIYRWKKIVGTGLDQGHGLGSHRYMKVKYESLTADPEAQMKEICEFLALDFDPSLLVSSMRQMDPEIQTDTIIHNTGKWREYFTEKQKEELELIAGRFLCELGYAVTKTPGNVDPPASRLYWWELCDHLQLTRFQLENYGIRYLPIYFRKTISALLQRITNLY
ncbi:MAG: sulfotransferase family protein [Planctomycetota bacterium]